MDFNADADFKMDGSRGTGHCMVYTMYCVLKHVLENNDIVNSAFDFV